jgi:hypothetical protein
LLYFTIAALAVTAPKAQGMVKPKVAPLSEMALGAAFSAVAISH